MQAEQYFRSDKASEYLELSSYERQEMVKLIMAQDAGRAAFEIGRRSNTSAIRRLKGQIPVIPEKTFGKKIDNPNINGDVGRDKGYTATDLDQIDPKTKERFDRLNQNDRSGKNFTQAGKENVRDINRQLNDGVEKCEGCGVRVVDPQQSQKGVTPPNNEAHVDHIKRKSEGGSGTPDNGQVLCRDCNVNEKH